MAETNLVLTELNDCILTITLNRPKVNAFNLDMILATQAAFREAERDDRARVVVLTGSGSVFSAGQDVTDFVGAEQVSFRSHLQRTYNPLVMQIRRLEKPVIAAINGAVSGAALGIALACDLRIASEQSRFVVGFGGIGLAPDSAVSLLLPALIGLGRATEFTFSNAPISAEQALTWGLVNRLAPHAKLHSAATAWAAELARSSVRAMGFAKRAFNKAVLSSLEEALDYEAHLQEIAGRGPDHYEGVRAFLEKRPAVFNTSEP